MDQRRVDYEWRNEIRRAYIWCKKKVFKKCNIFNENILDGTDVIKRMGRKGAKAYNYFYPIKKTKKKMTL